MSFEIVLAEEIRADGDGTTYEMRALLNAMSDSMRRKLLDKSWKMTEAFAEQACQGVGA